MGEMGEKKIERENERAGEIDIEREGESKRERKRERRGEIYIEREETH